MKTLAYATLGAITCLCTPNMLSAQGRDVGEGGYESQRRDSGRVGQVSPYIEAAQIVSAELSPDSDVVTYTQVAAGVDASLQGRNTGASVSIRYEYNVGYGDAVDSNTLSGVARGYATVVPQVLTVEAGGLAARTRIDGNGGSTLNPLLDEDSDSRIYSVYAGPTVHTRAGDAEINANYRIGYTRVDAPDVLQTAPGVDPVDVFDDSVVQSAGVHVGLSPGQPLPVGVGVGAGWVQEDVSNLDQRVRDMHVRADVSLPVTHSLAVVGGIGYEDVEVSARDAVRDADGNPIVGSDGRLVMDDSQPRQIAYEADGLIWDVGVMWRPSRRTALEAHVGRRYDSTTYYGTFSYNPDRRSSLNVSVYDSVSGFGNLLTNSLANLPTEFSATRNALTGDFTGCVDGVEGDNCLAGTLASIRSSVFRSRGIAANYGVQLGRFSTGIGAGYDRRKFIAAPGTILATANGVVDESYYVTAYLSGELGRNAGFSANTYANWVNSGFVDAGDVFALGASASYSRALLDRLSARAAVAIDHIDSDITDEDITAASALLGLRYDF